MPLHKTAAISCMYVLVVGMITQFTFCVVNVSHEHAAAFYILMIKNLCDIALFGMGIALLAAMVESLVTYSAYCSYQRSNDAENMMLTCAAIVVKLGDAGTQAARMEMEKSMNELLKLHIEKMVQPTPVVDEAKCKDEISPASESSSTRSGAITTSDE